MNIFEIMQRFKHPFRIQVGPGPSHCCVMPSGGVARATHADRPHCDGRSPVSYSDLTPLGRRHSELPPPCRGAQPSLVLTH